MKKIALAYSGGLDTSFCIPYLTSTYDAEVIAIHVDCKGLSESEKTELTERAHVLGAVECIILDGRQRMYESIIAYLIKGNVLRDRCYPLSVGVERFIQAQMLVEEGLSKGCTALAHGSTGAGNDQIRFDTVFSTLAPQLPIYTPIRSKGFNRPEMVAALEKDHGLTFSHNPLYSVNEGLWGLTIGGKETTSPSKTLPIDAFPHLSAPHELNDEPEWIRIGFKSGLPVSLNGEELAPIELLTQVTQKGFDHGIGRGLHTGDTILGFKGRIGFEAPAATLLYAAHIELEKSILSKYQRMTKDSLSDTLGMLWHEARYFDPVIEDIKAFLDQNQQPIEGEVTLYVYRGNVYPTDISSEQSLVNRKTYTYGETSQLWNGEEAQAFAKMYGLGDRFRNHSNV